MTIKRLSHAVYDTRYHLVWAPKYRKWILTDEVGDSAKELFEEIARYNGLRALGVSDRNARPIAASRKGPWVMSNMKPVKVAMPNGLFAERGLLSLLNHYESLAKTI